MLLLCILGANKELRRNELADYGIGLGRGWVNGEAGFGYPTQAEVHGKPLTMYAVGIKWWLRSNSSNAGAEVAIQVEEFPRVNASEPLYVPTEWR